MSIESQFMTDAEYAEYRIDALKSAKAHQNELIATILEAIDDEIFEWEGKGCFFYDPHGRKYFDASTGAGVFALGHAHPQVVSAVCEQAKKGGLSTRAGFVPKQLELLKKLSEIVPGHYKHGFIGSTGTEVIEAALRLARLTTGRKKIIGMESGYHGMSATTISVTGVPYCHMGENSDNSNSLIIPYNDLEAADKFLTEDVAAVILEPIQWAAGCRVASSEFLQGLRKLCDERGVLMILDEIQTGLGRIGHWFASDIAKIIPDMTICGKALSGGMVPIAAVMYSDKIHRAEAKFPLFINSTFAGNPLACAAALATIKIIKEQNLVERAGNIGAMMLERLERLHSLYPDIIAGQSGMGTMRCLITVQPHHGTLLSAFLHREHEVWLPALMYDSKILRISPPYIASDKEIEDLFNAIESVCKKLHEMGEDGIHKHLAEVQAKIAQKISISKTLA